MVHGKLNGLLVEQFTLTGDVLIQGEISCNHSLYQSLLHISAENKHFHNLVVPPVKKKTTERKDNRTQFKKHTKGQSNVQL